MKKKSKVTKLRLKWIGKPIKVQPNISTWEMGPPIRLIIKEKGKK